MSQEMQRKPLFLVEDLETLKVISDPLRFQILELLDRSPATVTQVAQKLDTPASRLYYHFTLLEKHGLIRVVETRMVSNILEKIYWATAETIEIDRTLLDFSKGEMQDSILNLVTNSIDALRTEMLRSLQVQTESHEDGAKSVPQEFILRSTHKRLSNETYHQFLQNLMRLLKEFDALPEEIRSGDDVNDFKLACYFFPNFHPLDEESEG